MLKTEVILLLGKESRLERDVTGVTSGKFVQLLHVDIMEYLVMAAYDFCQYHAQIIKEFADRQEPKWNFHLVQKGDDGKLKEEDKVIRGGGRFELNERDKSLFLGGASMAYGPYEIVGLNERLEQSDFLKGYRISC